MIARSSLVLLGAAGVVGLMLFAVGCIVAPEPMAVDKNNPLGPNATCCACHTNYIKEPLSRMHLKHKVYCIDCHGPSKAHANASEKDIGETRPDICFQRSQVNGACRKCHSRHTAAKEKVAKRRIEKKLTVTPEVCTDCHGSHKIKRAKDDNLPPGNTARDVMEHGEQ